MKRILPVLFVLFLLICTAACTGDIEATVTETPEPAKTEPPVEVIVDDVTVPVTELIIQSWDEMPDPETLSEMTSLRLIDLTALPYTSTSEIESIWLELPEGQHCQIIWNQMLTDGVFRSDSQELTLPHATREDVNLLEVFSHLRKVDATGSTEIEALYAYQQSHPDVEVHYALVLGEETYNEQTETIRVPEGVDPEAFLSTLKAFPNVKELDLRESAWSTVWIESYKKSFPDMSIRYRINIGSLTFDSDASMLDLRTVTNMTSEQMIDRLSAFSKLETVALPSGWAEQEIQSIRNRFPDVAIIGSFTAFGRTIDGGAEEIDLSNTKISTVEAVEDLLKQAPFLKKLVLCECGLTDEQMASLCDAHTEIKFVWTLSIGKRKLRTDAIGFSTKNPGKYTSANASDKYNESVKKAIRLKEGDIEMLKYCTDLEALDLGHNYLTNSDLIVISKLTKLKVLILADNKITDISALTTLKDLEYIELFMNKIPDLSPLCEMPNLRDVNVCNTGVSDLTPLFQLTSAKRLWYAMNPFNRTQAKELKDALPDCVCNYTTKDETGEGWRTDPRYQWMRAYFQDS